MKITVALSHGSMFLLQSLQLRCDHVPHPAAYGGSVHVHRRADVGVCHIPDQAGDGDLPILPAQGAALQQGLQLDCIQPGKRRESALLFTDPPPRP